MPNKISGTRGISDDAVVKATGKSWSEWYKILDEFDRKTKGHTLTAKHLNSEYKLNPWWSQMVTVRYEWEKGLREK
jgi:hypothetical protein